MLAVFHNQAAEAGIRPGQLGAGPERFGDRHRRLGRGPRLGARHSRHIVMESCRRAGAFAQPVTGLTPQPECALNRVEGVLPPVEQPQLTGETAVQLRDHRRGRPGREAQRPLELRCRLAVRGQLGRLPRGG